MQIKRTRECAVQQLRTELASSLSQRLDNSNRILACFETEETHSVPRLFIDGSETVFAANVLTQRELIRVSTQGDVASMPLINVATIKEEKPYGGGYIVAAFGTGNTRINCTFASAETSQKFATLLRQTVEESKLSTTTDLLLPNEVEERLQALTRLHQNGLISEPEFRLKREEILKRL